MGNWLKQGKKLKIKILTHTNNLTTSSLVTIYSPDHEECMYELLNATEHALLALHSELCIIATLDTAHPHSYRTYLLDVCNNYT